MHATLSKSLKGDEVARELLSVISTEYGVTLNKLIAVMHDRASVNTVAVRGLKLLCPDIIDIGCCFSHTIDHVGDHFDTPILDKFGINWVSLFSHSPKARLLWRTRTGQSMRSYSQTRWWSRWEVYQQLLNLFGDVLPFLEENPDLSPSTRRKLLASHLPKTGVRLCRQHLYIKTSPPTSQISNIKYALRTGTP